MGTGNRPSNAGHKVPDENGRSVVLHGAQVFDIDIPHSESPWSVRSIGILNRVKANHNMLDDNSEKAITLKM